MRRTKEDAERTKNDILNAAVNLFSEKGVANTSLHEIAQAASVTRGAVYWHFQNKIEIFDALHDRLHQPLMDMILQGVENDHADPLEQIKNICVGLLIDLEDNTEKRQALTLFLTKHAYTGDLAPYRDKHKAKKNESMQLLARYFEKAKDQKLVCPDMNPETVTRSLNCYMKGILVEYLNDPQDIDLKNNAEKMISLFLKGITCRTRL